jgi:Uma2 family endonuclease
MAMPLAAHRFTVDEYHRMGKAGVLREDDRVELLDGQIVQMTPIGVRHAACVNRLNALLIGLAGTRATVSIQNPLILGEHEEPQPDVAVLRYRADGYQTGHPRAIDTLLVVEIADTSLAYDRDVKMPLYARAGIPEAWLVDLSAERIAVHHEPHAGRYTHARPAGPGDLLTPVHLPDVTLAVAEILA